MLPNAVQVVELEMEKMIFFCYMFECEIPYPLNFLTRNRLCTYHETQMLRKGRTETIMLLIWEICASSISFSEAAPILSLSWNPNVTKCHARGRTGKYRKLDSIFVFNLLLKVKEVRTIEFHRVSSTLWIQWNPNVTKGRARGRTGKREKIVSLYFIWDAHIELNFQTRSRLCTYHETQMLQTTGNDFVVTIPMFID